MSSETSVDIAGFARGDAEICAVVPVIVSLANFILRGCLAVVARRPLWRFPAFFGGAGASGSEDACFLSSALFVFLGMTDQHLNVIIRLSFISSLASAFSRLFTRSAKLIYK